MDGSVKIWDVFGRKECVRTFEHYGKNYVVLICKCKQRKAKLPSIYPPEAVKDIRWNNEASKLLSGGYNKLAKLIDVETGAISQVTIQISISYSFIHYNYSHKPNTLIAVSASNTNLRQSDIRTLKLRDSSPFQSNTSLVFCIWHVERRSSNMGYPL
jgi:WD40 repeat protein